MDQVKNQAQEQAGALAGRAKGMIVGQIDQRAGDIGATIATHAQNIRSVSATLREQGQDSTARLADTAADRLEQFGSYLSTTDGERLIADLENIARKQPLLTMGAGLALGILAARLLKASASERYLYYGQQPYTERYNENAPGMASMSYYED